MGVLVAGALSLPASASGRDTRRSIHAPGVGMAISGPRTAIAPSSHNSVLQRVLDPFVMDPRKIVLDLLIQPLIRLTTLLIPAVVVERHNVSQATNLSNFALVNVANLK